jgi:hypothetical protein
MEALSLTPTHAAWEGAMAPTCRVTRRKRAGQLLVLLAIFATQDLV